MDTQELLFSGEKKKHISATGEKVSSAACDQGRNPSRSVARGVEKRTVSKGRKRRTTL